MCHIYVLTRIMDTYLLIKYFKRQTSEQEDKEIQAWLAADTDGSRAKEYKKAHLLFAGMTVLWTPAAMPAKKKSNYSLRKALMTSAVAAVVAISIIVTSFLTKEHILYSLSQNVEKITVPSGYPMQLTLSDGTELWLNAGSVLEYPSVFSSRNRTVTLVSGEILFDVAKDAQRPFVVRTYASEISVLGTKFNVFVDEENQNFSATLIRGSIKVTNKENMQESFVLSPNEVVRKQGEHLYVERVEDVESVTCWTKGLIDVVNVPFDELMRRLERMYDVEIVIEKKDLPEVRYTWGKIRISGGIENALSILSQGADFTWKRDAATGNILIR